MGNTTSNMAIYIPTAGETGYDQSFAAGMVNVDQHDHSGAPNKGVPISSIAIADNSITFQKLNTNVADNTTGIGTAGAPFQNQLVLLGLLKNIYVNSTSITPSLGLLAVNAITPSIPAYRTITGTTNQIKVTNGDGSAGNPTLAFDTNLTLTGDLNVPAGSLTVGNSAPVFAGNISTATGSGGTITSDGVINATSGIGFGASPTQFLNAFATGTSTLALKFFDTGNDTGWTYTAPAEWCQIGPIVFFQGTVLITNMAGGYATGALTLTGLTSPNAVAGRNSSFIVETLRSVDLENRYYFCGEVNAGSTTISLWMVPGLLASTRKALNDTDINVNTSFTFNGFYFVA